METLSPRSSQGRQLESASTALHAEDLLGALQQPLLVLSADLTVEAANPAYCRRFLVVAEQIESRHLFDLNPAWDSGELRRRLNAAADGQGFEDHRIMHDAGGLGPRALRLAASPVAGRRILLTFSDGAREDQDRVALEAQRDYARKIVETMRDPFIVLDWTLRVRFANRHFYDAFLLQPEETVGQLIYEVDNGAWNIPRLRALLEDILPGNRSFDDYRVDHEFERTGRRTLLLNARRVEREKLILLVLEDVTERHLQDDRHKALMGELQHRVKNILMNVRALARQSRRGSRDIDEYVKVFNGRIEALARTQDLLVRSPRDALLLDELVRSELESQGAHAGKDFSLSGPDVRLPASSAQAMAMTVHELATNAARYGALSSASGQVEVAWSIEPGQGRDLLQFQWHERGVEMPDAPPRKGFGTKIIENGLPYLLGGSSELVFRPDGMDYAVSFPLPDR